MTSYEIFSDYFQFATTIVKTCSFNRAARNTILIPHLKAATGAVL